MRDGLAGAAFASRVSAAMAYYNRQLELTPALDERPQTPEGWGGTRREQRRSDRLPGSRCGTMPVRR